MFFFKDFHLKNGHLIVRQTGARLKLDGTLIREILAALPFYLSERLRNTRHCFAPRPKRTLAFLPGPARPWYLLPALVYRLRYRLAKSPETADILIYFEDATTGTPPALPKGFSGKTINFSCTDISKTKVAEAFAEVFGYDLAVDPRTYQGLIAVKSEQNGAHDGSLAQAPLAPDAYKADLVYQKLVDNRIDTSTVEDLRCPVVGGKIGLVFVKHRPVDNRFANFNSKVFLACPEDYLNPDERAKLGAFARIMGLDFGGMDVLRDRNDGRIYVVDVNKTDMGPPIALSLSDKNKSMDILARQLQALLHD